MIIVGGGKYDYDNNQVEKQSDKIVSFKIRKTSDAIKPLAFENKAENHMHLGIGNIGPYVEALEDKVVIAEGGYVRYLFLNSLRPKI